MAGCRKNAVFQRWQYRFEPNFQIWYVSIHTTYPANFIKITDTVPQIQQFKLKFTFSSENAVAG